MSDYGRLLEENAALKAENERLTAELAEAKKHIEPLVNFPPPVFPGLKDSGAHEGNEHSG